MDSYIEKIEKISDQTWFFFIAFIICFVSIVVYIEYPTWNVPFSDLSIDMIDPFISIMMIIGILMILGMIGSLMEMNELEKEKEKKEKEK